ncbi:hypothetical protein KCU89_g663, partial [Aureobasidium melanogenum]
MAPPEKGDILVIPVYSQSDEESLIDIKWQQSLRSKNAKFYQPRAKNQSKGDEDVLLYIQDSFYKDENSNNWIVPIDEHFQYGQKNAKGESRFLVLHNKDDKMYQHRFLVTTIQGTAAGWAKDIAGQFGAKEMANNVHSMGSGFVGDYLKNF